MHLWSFGNHVHLVAILLIISQSHSLWMSAFNLGRIFKSRLPFPCCSTLGLANNTDKIPAQLPKFRKAIQLKQPLVLHRGLSPQQVLLEEQKLAQTIYSPHSSKYSSHGYCDRSEGGWVGENGIFQLEMESPKWRKSCKPHLWKWFTSKDEIHPSAVYDQEDF